MGNGGDQDSGEDRLIGRFFRPFATDPRALGLLDDVALMTPPPGCDLVLKTDAVVGGVHFFPDDPPDAIARKALRVNLSDLAAKGADPSGCLMTLALPAGTPETWLEAFARGLAEDASAYGCPLLGGDMVRTPGPVMVSITVIGLTPAGSLVRRSGAKPGEQVVVSGTIGDAALGLRLRQDGSLAGTWHLDADKAAHLIGRYRLPEPRNVLAGAVRNFASAGMDISDGLAGDLAKLCRTSGVTARIEAGRVPLSDGARAALSVDPGLMEPILTGGDDYEIVCTVDESVLAGFTAAAAEVGTRVSVIGQIEAGEGAPQFIDANGQPLSFTRPSFSHF